MIEATRHPNPDKEQQRASIAKLNRIFKALLAEKTRQEVVQEVRDDNAGNPENSSTRPAHNPTRSVGIWNVLKEKITGGR
jgi:hypothetical protein